jgi:hypothetical protein
MRFPSFALLLPLLAVPVSAATVHLKLQADAPQAGQPVKITLKALSRVPVSLPAEPVVYVDEGQGFKVRTDLHCALSGAPLRLEADREATATCELPLSTTGQTKVRFGYRVGETLSTSNAVTLEAKAPAEARATK